MCPRLTAVVGCEDIRIPALAAVQVEDPRFAIGVDRQGDEVRVGHSRTTGVEHALVAPRVVPSGHGRDARAHGVVAAVARERHQHASVRTHQQRGCGVIVELEPVVQLERRPLAGREHVARHVDVAAALGGAAPGRDRAEQQHAVVDHRALVLEPAPAAVVVQYHRALGHGRRGEHECEDGTERNHGAAKRRHSEAMPASSASPEWIRNR